jgi:hypothetical protein
MCGDKNAMEWAAAWMAHKEPPTNKVGFMYMLRGDGGRIGSIGLADDQRAPMLLHSGKVPSQLPDHLAGFGSQCVLLRITVKARQITC